MQLLQAELLMILGGIGSVTMIGGMAWARRVIAKLDSIDNRLAGFSHFEGAVEGYIKDADRRFDEHNRRLEKLEDALV